MIENIGAYFSQAFLPGGVIFIVLTRQLPESYGATYYPRQK